MALTVCFQNSMKTRGLYSMFKLEDTIDDSTQMKIYTQLFCITAQTTGLMGVSTFLTRSLKTLFSLL